MASFETKADGVMLTSEAGDLGVAPGNKARARATKEANATGKPVLIRDVVSDKLLAKVTPDKAAKAPAKARAKPAKVAKDAPKAAKPSNGAPKAARRDRSAPTGMTAELVKLASRARGVTPAQLNEHSKWKGAPWKWFFSNPKRTGVADRFGYKFKAEKDGRAVTYFLTAK